MYKRYEEKHYNGKIKLNIFSKMTLAIILLILLAVNSMSGILSYFTSIDSSTNNFTLAGVYTVHFDSNSGTGTMLDKKIIIGVSESLPPNSFTRTGYTFAGWNTQANGSGTDYTDEQSVTNLSTTENDTVTLYAQWNPVTYNITYALNDGTVATSNPITYNVETATFTLNNPTKEGYTFKGWSGTDLTGDTNLVVTVTQGSTGDRSYTANWRENNTPITYYIRFNANGGTGTMSNQEMTYGTAANLTTNTIERPAYVFTEWNTEPDGSGTSYADEASVNNLTETDGDIVDLYAQWTEETNQAEVVGDKKYATVQAAINAVAAGGGQKTIKLLKNVALNSVLNVASGKDIVFNLQNFTLSNGSGCTNIIKNSGTLEISGGSNGKIQTSASYGAVDNEASGNLTVSGGNIITTGDRQAIYNNGGTVEITGDAYLSTNAPDRATVLNNKPNNGTSGIITISGGTIISTTTTTKGAVENASTGTMYITGGTIISEHKMGVDNKGTLTIGIEDADIDTSSPIIQGATYGVNSVSSQTLEFYDGTVKGGTHAFNNENYITDMEDNSELIHGSETIDGDNYETAYLDDSINILRFNGNGGTPTETIVYVQDDAAIGELLPSEPSRRRYSFDGWFTDPTGGTQITSSTVINSNGTYYAHWTQTEALVKFDANGGTLAGDVSEETIPVNCGTSIGNANLPAPTKQYKAFVGWFTEETGGTQIDGTETITQDVTYYAHWNGVNVTVTFDPNLGTIPQADATRTVEAGDEVGTLPTTATRTDYGFAGWYTAASGGTRITSSEIVTGTTTYYAHWISDYVAEMDSVKYETLQDAVDAVPTDNTEKTITLLADTLEGVDVVANKNIVLNLQNFTLSNDGSIIVDKDPVAIRNRGTIKIISGTVTASSRSAAINNETGGRLIITGGSVTNTGTGDNGSRQAIYNNGGTLEISGTAYLSAKNSGDYKGSDRGAIQNLNSGTIIITGGTIESSTSHAIVNQSGCTLTIGTKDGTIDSTTPVIQGYAYGIQNKATFNFYDGIVKGITDSISGTVTNTEIGATMVDATETIGTDTYKTTCYQ